MPKLPPSRQGRLLWMAPLFTLLTTLAPMATAQQRSDNETQVPWQRSLDTALVLAEQSGRPLLICVNADGEPASESLAARRYKNPDFIRLMQGFVPVIASAFQHAPQSHDERGRRIPCPRFGTITCQEHIALEPLVFQQWFEGLRIAPRHVGIDENGEVLFDLYLLNSLNLIDSTLRAEGQSGKRLADPEKMSEKKLLASFDARANELLEERLLNSEEKARVGLVAASLDSKRPAQHPELIRLGLNDPSALVRRTAAEHASTQPDLLSNDILERAASALHDSDAAVMRITQELSARKDAAANKRGLLLAAAREPADILNFSTWIPTLEVDPEHSASTNDESMLSELVAQLDEEISAAPKNATLRTQLARAYLDLSRARTLSGEEDVSYLWDLAHKESQRESDLSDTTPVAHAVFARTDWLLGGAASTAAPAAARALPGLLGEARSQLVAETLDVLVQARAEQTFDAMDAGELPEPLWISEIAAGARLLLHHPNATAWQRAAALDVLGALQLDGLHTELAWLGATLHPTLPEMHEHLRWHLVRDGDPSNVQAAYAALLETTQAHQKPTVTWFAAFAQLQAADRLRDAQRTEESASTYRKSLETFEIATSLDRSLANTATYVSLAYCGLARLLLSDDDTIGAAEQLLDGLESNPGALDTPDASGLTPRLAVETTLTRLADEKPKPRKKAQDYAKRLQGLLDI
ncbi:MAG: hypothetical protein P8N09_13680 [Planctomycetota bacterium]|nr:hypothetical protein [Planctomycetota bacterium]